jgi:hypothetical protein
MIGFILGTACLLGLGKAYGRRRYFGHGHRGWHGEDGVSGFSGPVSFLRPLFLKLETTPGQERVIVQSVKDLQLAREKMASDLKGWRKELATALRMSVFDETTVGTLSAQIENALLEMRKAGIDAFAKVHEVLDEKQRAHLAETVEHGWGPLFGLGSFATGPERQSGPYRTHAERENDERGFTDHRDHHQGYYTHQSRCRSHRSSHC